MLFNTLDFALFLPVVFLLYWFVFNKNLKFQNGLLLLSSYFFYGCWDWRFLFLLLFSTLLDYYTGIKMQEAENKKTKKFWFWLSILTNLGFLGFIKYYTFFITSFEETVSKLGLHIDIWTLKIILPIGISFYTFHGLSYVIDIYNDKIKAERNFIDYAVFVSFFPLLVAGPIERATHLLPQIKKKRKFNYGFAINGLKQILWGLFKKIVIADNCAEFANTVFNQSEHQSGSTLIMGAVFFAIQIYCDFSGYSDIALGTARLFGIELLRNFAFPYFSRDIAEFWRRWHISLSSWFRDYLYIPLGGSRVNEWMKIRNTFIIFIVSGFWHGANWTFIIWGFLNALYILPSILFRSNRNHLDIVAQGKMLPTLNETLSMLLTFALTVFAWIFFRSESVKQAFHIVAEIFSGSTFSIPEFPINTMNILVLFFIAAFFIIEWFGREQQYAIAILGANWPKPLRYAFYYFLLLSMFVLEGKSNQFIYFQF